MNTYSPAGRLLSRTSPAGRSERFEYDIAGRCAAMVGIDGQWRDNWGLNWVKIPAGAHQVCFGSAPAATAPACASVDLAAGSTATVTGTYLPKGFLRVVTDPALPATITVDGQVANAYGIWTAKVPASYSVCFGVVPGFAVPPCQNALVAAGATTTITGTYGPT